MSDWPFLMKWKLRRNWARQSIYEAGVTRAAKRAERREAVLIRAAFLQGYQRGLIDGQLGLIDRGKSLH